MASAMCCYSCRAFEDVFWPAHLRAVAHTTTPHRGDSPPFCPLRCASYLPFVVSLSPQFLFPLRHLSVPCLLIRSARRAAPSAFDIRPLHSPFKASRKKKCCTSESVPPRVSSVVRRTAPERRRDSPWRANPPQPIRPVGIVQARRRQTRGKYAINLQDISCEAPIRTASDVTLGASMSKCHDKLLHIIPCFYLMTALCVGCAISPRR